MERHRERILLISVNNFYGGGEVHLRNLARLLADCCEIHTLVFDKALAADLESLGVKVHRISVFPKSMRLLQVVHAFFVLPFLAVKHRVRTVVISGTIEAILLPPMKIMGRRTISIRHLSPFLGHGGIICKGRRLLIEAVYAVGILFADQVVCVSESVAKGMRRIALHKRIRVIPNWVPSIPEKNSRREWQRPVRLLFVGRLEHHKGLHLLLSALGSANDYELIVVGDGVEAAQLRQMAQGKTVRFEGFQPDTAKYYRDADIFIMPSLGPEGMPLVTLEAMAYALPCILSDLPVHVDVSCGGKNALLFETGRVESLRARLGTLFVSSFERHRLGDRAYQHVLEKYSPAAAKKSYLDILALLA